MVSSELAACGSGTRQYTNDFVHYICVLCSRMLVGRMCTYVCVLCSRMLVGCMCTYVCVLCSRMLVGRMCTYVCVYAHMHLALSQVLDDHSSMDKL